jgi:hypothetical protein
MLEIHLLKYKSQVYALSRPLKKGDWVQLWKMAVTVFSTAHT